MDVFYFPDDSRPGWHQPVLALGNFDGLHRGHTKIVDRVRQRAGERGAAPVVMTFDPHPPRIVRPDKAPPLLMTTDQRLEAFARAGMQGVAVIRFSTEISRWDPEEFVRRALVQWAHVSEVWVGANFLFGHDRSGNFSLLRTLGARYGFRAEKIDPVRYKDFVVSSTRIRRLVSEGRVDEAGVLLGHHYFIDGTVVEGDRRGRTIGVPTANVSPTTSCCRRAASTPRWPPTTARRCRRSPTWACGPPSAAASGMSSRRTCSTSSATSTAGGCAWRSSSGSGTSARFPTWTRSRSRSRPTSATPAGCSTGFRCKIT